MPEPTVEPANTVLIVTGSTLGAEAYDRPTAYGLARALGSLLGPGGLSVGVCSDVWYLNQAGLRSRPAISVGGPGVNAFTAYLADRLPSAYVVDGDFVVQADLDFEDVLAACWGTTHAGTAVAVTAFRDRYAAGFARAALACGALPA
ncbi:MAG: hypothetical protein HRU70_04300 [Phycisphaeraceae bacterium]|nr:MAG: hypothetical protein HRU70_04300 [Phycisphaeraceae bacterium]